MTPHETGAPATRPSLIGPPRWLLSREASASQGRCSPLAILVLVRVRPGPQRAFPLRATPSSGRALPRGLFVPVLPELVHAPVPLGDRGLELLVVYLAGQPAACRLAVYGPADGETPAHGLGGRGGEALGELLLRRRPAEDQQARAVRVVLADHVPDPGPHPGVRVRRDLPPLGMDTELVEPPDQGRHALPVVGRLGRRLDLQQQLPVVC